MSDSPVDVFQFPCAFPLKAMGHNTDEFEGLVVTIVRRHAPDLADQRREPPPQFQRQIPIGHGHLHGPQPRTTRRALHRTQRATNKC